MLLHNYHRIMYFHFHLKKKKKETKCITESLCDRSPWKDLNSQVTTAAASM